MAVADKLDRRIESVFGCGLALLLTAQSSNRVNRGSTDLQMNDSPLSRHSTLRHRG